MSKLSGFPEWSPDQRMIEQRVLDRLRSTFELYGFAPLETRAVEPLEQLLRKGETSKEVYLLRRLQADADSEDDALGLHFDLTVPFARYVLENAGKLQFPFRRYQIQKVWRGERPQEGRYREFLQADIDVVDRDTLAGHYEAEIPLVIGDALGGLPIPPVRILVNNRKLAEGFYRGLGLTATDEALRAIDKLDKIGPDKVAELLVATAGASEAQAKACLALAEISADDDSLCFRCTGVAGRTPAPRPGPGRAGGRGRDGPRARARAGPGQPQDRPGTRLLHRHRVRDRAHRLREVRLDLLRAAATTTWPRRATTGSPGSASRSACRACSACSSGPARCRSPGRCRPPSWSRCRTTRTAAACNRIAAALRARGVADRGGRRARPSSASRSASPSGAGSRTSGSPAIPPNPAFLTRSRTSAPASRFRPTPRRGARPPKDLHPAVTMDETRTAR